MWLLQSSVRPDDTLPNAAAGISARPRAGTGSDDARAIAAAAAPAAVMTLLVPAATRASLRAP